MVGVMRMGLCADATSPAYFADRYARCLVRGASMGVETQPTRNSKLSAENVLTIRITF